MRVQRLGVALSHMRMRLKPQNVVFGASAGPKNGGPGADTRSGASPASACIIPTQPTVRVTLRQPFSAKDRRPDLCQIRVISE